MHWVSSPVSSIKGTITVPGDKSISHRALFLGAMAEGITTIRGFSNGEDCKRTWRAFEAMGVRIEYTLEGTVLVYGVGKYGLSAPKAPLECGNSGTTMRLFMGLLAAQSFDSVLVGDASLHQRPMARISAPLMEMGAVMRLHEGRPPVFIQGGLALHRIDYEMPYASAQLKTALLLAGMRARGQTRIIEPAPTRDHTERMLMSFAYPLPREGEALVMDSRHALRGADIDVPGDLSAAAFFIVAATLIPGSTLTLHHVGVNPTRAGILEVLNEMGASITLDKYSMHGAEPVARIRVRHAPLKGIEIPATHVPFTIDEYPILFIAAACAVGTTRMYGLGELRHKESDRINMMIAGLVQLGIHAYTEGDDVVIEGGALLGGVVSSGGDHRVAMAFAVAGAVAATSVTVLNCNAVSTSYPHFLNTANQLKLVIESIDDESA